MRRSLVLFALVGVVAGLGLATAGMERSAAQAQTPPRLVVFESFMRKA